jgi:hypothetical protein
MHAEKDAQRTAAHAEKTAFVQRARKLLGDIDLMDADSLAQAREILRREGIPQWTLFAVRETPDITEDGMRWAEQRLAELKASGDVP